MNLEGNSSDNDVDIDLQVAASEQMWTDLSTKNSIGEQAEGVKPGHKLVRKQ